MLDKMTTEAMAASIKAFTPSVNNLLVERMEGGNAILTISGFVGDECLQLGLNIANQYFAPRKSWTELGSVETEAEIGFQLRPTTVGISAEGTLQQVTLQGATVELTGVNLVAFAEHLLALYRFWFTSPAFRHKAQAYFPV